MPEADLTTGPAAGAAQTPAVVPTEVSLAKLESNLADVRRTGAGRGRWEIVRWEAVQVEIVFFARPMGSNLTVVPAMIRLDYTDYDVRAPSLLFLDPIDRVPALPTVIPVEVADGGARPLVPGPHPETGLPFLCVPNVAEFHSHPQHDDGSWLARWRGRGAGRVEVICDELWKSMCPDLVIETQMQMQLRRLPKIAVPVADPAPVPEGPVKHAP